MMIVNGEFSVSDAMQGWVRVSFYNFVLPREWPEAFGRALQAMVTPKEDNHAGS